VYPFNIDNPYDFRMSNFANESIKLTATYQKIVYLPLPQDDLNQRQPNVTKAKSILDWEPNIIR